MCARGLAESAPSISTRSTRNCDLESDCKEKLQWAFAVLLSTRGGSNPDVRVTRPMRLIFMWVPAIPQAYSFFSRFLSPNPDLPRMTCVRRLLVKVRDLAQSRTPSSPVGPGSVFPANQLKLAVLLLCPRASINQWKQGGTDRFGILGEFFSNFLWTIY